jgi:hypothetical protein
MDRKGRQNECTSEEVKTSDILKYDVQDELTKENKVIPAESFKYKYTGGR